MPSDPRRALPDAGAPPRPADVPGLGDRGLGDRGLQMLLVGVALLQAFSWTLLDGYQLADSVEYMERAQAFVRGEIVIDSQTIRSFGFSSLLAPFFWLADRFGIEDLRPLVWISRFVQMVMGLLLVRICVRLGAQLGGRRVGLAAGLICGVNPVFLQYSVSPVADIAAAACVGQGLEVALRRGGLRHGIRAGLWMGLALLAAYKTILIFAAVGLLVAARERMAGRRMWIGMLVGYGLAAIGQVVLDKLTYGAWGASFFTYFFVNAAPIIGTALHDLGFHEIGWAIYKWGVGEVQRNPDLTSIQSRTWYLDNLPHMLVWPVILCTLIGSARSLLRPTWSTLLPLLAFALSAGFMTIKGSKDFRLWIPLLPMLAPLAAYGWAAIRGPERARNSTRRMGAGLLLIGALVLGLRELRSGERSAFAAYWDAIEWVSEQCRVQRAQSPDRRKPRVASAYHWAVYLKETKDVDLVKLPRQLTGWTGLGPDDRNRNLLDILEMDWLILHRPVLSNPGHRDLVRVVNDGFYLAALFHGAESVDPVMVFARRTGAPEERGLVDQWEDIGENDPTAYVAQQGPEPGWGEPLRLLRSDLREQRRGGGVPGDEELLLLGSELRLLPGDGHALLTYHYYVPNALLADYASIDRLTLMDGKRFWDKKPHPPAYGAEPTSRWRADTIVRVSWPVIAGEPVESPGMHPMDGPQRRTEAAPGELWHRLATFDAEGVTGSLEPALAGESEPLDPGSAEGGVGPHDGLRWSPDGLARVASVLVPPAGR